MAAAAAAAAVTMQINDIIIVVLVVESAALRNHLETHNVDGDGSRKRAPTRYTRYTADAEMVRLFEQLLPKVLRRLLGTLRQLAECG